MKHVDCRACRADAYGTYTNADHYQSERLSIEMAFLRKISNENVTMGFESTFKLPFYRRAENGRIPRKVTLLVRTVSIPNVHT